MGIMVRQIWDAVPVPLWSPNPLFSFHQTIQWNKTSQAIDLAQPKKKQQHTNSGPRPTANLIPTQQRYSLLSWAPVLPPTKVVPVNRWFNNWTKPWKPATPHARPFPATAAGTARRRRRVVVRPKKWRRANHLPHKETNDVPPCPFRCTCFEPT